MLCSFFSSCDNFKSCHIDFIISLMKKHHIICFFFIDITLANRLYFVHQTLTFQFTTFMNIREKCGEEGVRQAKSAEREERGKRER